MSAPAQPLPRAPATLGEVRATLRLRRDEVREPFRVELTGVVGSLARGCERLDSDVDVFAEYLPGATLLKIGAAICLLEEETGREVDLIDAKMLKPEMRSAMERDLVIA